MTASGTRTYPGIYKARCVSVSGTDITAYVPQIFGDVKVVMQSAIDAYPLPGVFGYVVFEGGDPAFPIWAGTSASLYSSPDEPLHVEMVRATKEPLGHTDFTQSAISFNNDTRTFTIAPVDDFFEVWCVGKAYRKTAAETVAIPDVSGLYYIYYSDIGILSYKTSFFTWDSDTPTAYIYWNADTQKAEFFADERHGASLDWATHEYLHRTRGAVLANGFTAYNYVIGGNGSLDSHAQLDLGEGTFFDEDLEVHITHSNSPKPNTWQQDLQGPARIPVMYKSGTHWKVDAPTDFPMKKGTTTIQYNSVVGSTWSTTDVANNHYAVMFIIATNNLNYPILSVMGQTSNSNFSKLQEYLWSDMDLAGLPIVEFRLLYKVIFKALTGAANTPKAAIVEIEDLRLDETSSLALPQQVSTSPTGSLTAFAGSEAPTGWLMCYGQPVSRATYSALFSVIGTTYGTGDGSTTFNLPDLRGRVPVALDNMGGTDAGRLSTTNSLGITGGEEKHLLITSEMPSHTHTQDQHTHTQTNHTHANTLTDNKHTHQYLVNIQHGDGAVVTGESLTSGLTLGGRRRYIDTTNINNSSPMTLTNAGATANIQSATAVNQNTGGDTAHNNMQPYILMNYIIKT